MTEASSFDFAEEQQIDSLCDRFEIAWRDGQQPSLTDFLEQTSEQLQLRVLAELWAIEQHHRRDEQGHTLTDAQLSELHPQLAGLLEKLPTLDGAAGAPVTWAGQPSTALGAVPGAPRGGAELPVESRGLHIRCPHCSNAVELLADSPVEDVECASCGSHFSLVDSSDEPEAAHALETVGRFELMGRLGVGGFGTVWKARDTELDRVVALKIPRKGRLNARETEQFLREARSAAQLRHPNIVPVFEIGREDNALFIVSEFVRGVTLSKWIENDSRNHRESARLCAIVADALHAAHQEGVVHRDLKPSNVMLDLTGRPRLMDFGLAKRDAGEITMTMDGQVLGTPAYMSPEQARGLGHWTDRRADIYSLGVMLFEMLTGELPFRGSAAIQIQKRLTADAPSPMSLDRGVPEDLSTICSKCMEQDPNRRYQASVEVADELRRYLDDLPIKARPLSHVGHALRWSRRRPATAVAIALGVFLAIAGPVVAALLASKNRAIQTRLDERVAFIAGAEQDKAELRQQIGAIKQRLFLLTGGREDSETASLRVELTASVLDARQSEYEAQLDQLPPGEEKAKGHLGLGLLLNAAGRLEGAVRHLKNALDQQALPRALEVQGGVTLAKVYLLRNQQSEGERTLRAVAPDLSEETLSDKLAALDVRMLAVTMVDDREQLKKAWNAASRFREGLEAGWPADVGGVLDLAQVLTHQPIEPAMLERE